MNNTLKVIFKTLTWLGLIAIWLILIYKLFFAFCYIILVEKTLLIYLVVAIILFALGIIFRKKIRGGITVAFVYATILSVVINFAIYAGFVTYLSDYNRDKWDKYVEYRHFMLTDLRNEYGLIGLNEEEIKNLLGEPNQIEDRTEGFYDYHYYSGFRSRMDAYVLEIVFKDGVSVNVVEGER